MHLEQLLHSPVLYIGLFLLSVIVAPKQYYNIIYRTLTVLAYIVAIPFIIVFATISGIVEGLNRSEQKKQYDRQILKLRLQYANELCKVGVRCAIVPFKLLLFIPPIRRNYFAGIRDAKRLNAFIDNSQLSPNHPFTVYHPFKSFLLAIPALFRRGYRRYAGGYKPARRNAVKRPSRYGYKWVAIWLLGDFVRRSSVATTPKKPSSSVKPAIASQPVNTVKPGGQPGNAVSAFTSWQTASQPATAYNPFNGPKPIDNPFEDIDSLTPYNNPFTINDILP